MKRSQVLTTASVCFVLASRLTAQGVPWKEKAELSIAGQTLAPTTAARLHNSEVMVVSSDLLSIDGNGHYLLDVSPWLQVNSVNICEGEPFRGQPRAANCSGFLVGPDLVHTAGHCVFNEPSPQDRTYPCDGQYHVIFDWADQGPISQSGTIELVDGTVFECDEVLIDTIIGVAVPLPLWSPTEGNDYAILQLNPSLPLPDRLPLVTERTARTVEGDGVLVLGHPNGLPFKGEIATALETPSQSDAHILGGSSGSGVVGLGTGKVAFNVTGGNDEWPKTIDEPPAPICNELDFNSGDQYSRGTMASIWNADIPPLGLQVTLDAGAPSATYYGPPTTPVDFPTFQIDLDVPLDGLPTGTNQLDWEVRTDNPTLVASFDVVSGPSSGQLGELGFETLEFAPTSNTTSGPGVTEEVLPFFDYLYETREPIVHTAYVGVEGFTLTPDEDFLGEGDLGVMHGATREYTPRNRWIVFQDVTVSASQDWIELAGIPGTTPQTHSLPPVYSAAPEIGIPLVINGTGLAPGLKEATVTFSSDDSGTPAFERNQLVRFDHCRQMYDPDGSDLPWEPTIPPGQSRSISFGVTADPPLGAIDDVDVAVGLDVGFGGTYSVTLESPDGTPVLLKDFPDGARNYYDQDNVTPSVPLDLLEAEGASGPWKLIVGNHVDAKGDFLPSLTRWEVRLHVVGADNCVP